MKYIIILFILIFAACEDDTIEPIAMIQPAIFKDIRDGQIYNLVTIGGNQWFKENLNYESNNSFVIEYGRLYEWNLVCPPGSHMPDSIEWTTLIDYIGGDSRKLKSNSLWNCEGTNESVFTALPGGMKVEDNYYPLGEAAYFWSSTLSEGLYPYFFSIDCKGNEVFSNPVRKELAMSVRCVKD